VIFYTLYLIRLVFLALTLYLIVYIHIIYTFLVQTSRSHSLTLGVGGPLAKEKWKNCD